MSKTLDLDAVNFFLGGLDYPETRDDLVRNAAERKPPDSIIEAILSLTDREYGSQDEVMDQLNREGYKYQKGG